MTIKIKTKVDVKGVSVINNHTYKMGRFEELVRFDKRDSVFKQWRSTVRLYKTKPFATGFVKYEYP